MTFYLVLYWCVACLSCCFFCTCFTNVIPYDLLTPQIFRFHACLFGHRSACPFCACAIVLRHTGVWWWMCAVHLSPFLFKGLHLLTLLFMILAFTDKGKQKSKMVLQLSTVCCGHMYTDVRCKDGVNNIGLPATQEQLGKRWRRVMWSPCFINRMFF